MFPTFTLTLLLYAEEAKGKHILQHLSRSKWKMKKIMRAEEE